MRAFDPATRLRVQVEVVPSPPRAGQQVRWVFTVVNGGSEPRRLSFTSAQQADVVLEAAGRERYRWSRDKLFAAVIIDTELAAGEERVIALDDVLSVEPGDYSLVATLTASPRPPSVRGAVSVA
jgi:intracellular proteinase inhibitor BsuPI